MKDSALEPTMILKFLQHATLNGVTIIYGILSVKLD